MAFQSGQRVTIQATIVRQEGSEASYRVVLSNGLEQVFDLFELKADDDLPDDDLPPMEDMLYRMERYESVQEKFRELLLQALERNPHEAQRQGASSTPAPPTSESQMMEDMLYRMQRYESMQVMMESSLQQMTQKHERVLERLNLIEKRDRQRLYKLQDHVDDMQEKVNEMATHLLDWTAMD